MQWHTNKYIQYYVTMKLKVKQDQLFENCTAYARLQKSRNILSGRPQKLELEISVPKDIYKKATIKLTIRNKELTMVTHLCLCMKHITGKQ